MPACQDLVLSGENGLTINRMVLNCFNLSYVGGDGGGGSDIFGCTDESASTFNPDADWMMVHVLTRLF